MHNHIHFKKQYQRFGSLSHTGSFGQESLIGYIGRNSHATRFIGENICYQYSIDHALQNYDSDHYSLMDSKGLIDAEDTFDFSSHSSVMDLHRDLCGCHSLKTCLRGFKRYLAHQKCFHSLSYGRRQTSVSYFVRCRNEQSNFLFGKIVIFFMLNTQTYSLMQLYPLQDHFSDFFRGSKSYFLLQKPLGRFFYRLSSLPLKDLVVVPVDNVLDHVIVFEQSKHFIATPVSSYNEHN